jgi:hypothetical protein
MERSASASASTASTRRSSSCAAAALITGDVTSANGGPRRRAIALASSSDPTAGWPDSWVDLARCIVASNSARSISAPSSESTDPDPDPDVTSGPHSSRTGCPMAEDQPSRQVPTRRQTEPRSSSTARPRRLLARRPATQWRRRLAHSRARLPISLVQQAQNQLIPPTPHHADHGNHSRSNRGGDRADIYGIVRRINLPRYCECLHSWYQGPGAIPDGTYFVGPAPAPGQPDTRRQVMTSDPLGAGSFGGSGVPAAAAKAEARAADTGFPDVSGVGFSRTGKAGNHAGVNGMFNRRARCYKECADTPGDRRVRNWRPPGRCWRAPLPVEPHGEPAGDPR